MVDEREQRNSIFTGQQAPVADPKIPSVSAADQVRADFGLDIPVELAPLPSNGKVYAQTNPLFNQTAVEIHSMTAREEDILTSRALLKKGTVITELIRSCLVNKNINPIDLLVGDRNALMVAIRITGYGAEYDVEVECDECSEKTPQTFNLAALPIRILELEPEQEGQNLFSCVLPYTKKTVKFKLMTGRDEEEMSIASSRMKKIVTTDATVTTNLQYSIVSIDGISDRQKINQFVRMMPARDSLMLRNYIRENEPGLIMRQEIACKACGHVDEVSMPISTSFLWPSAGR